MFKCEILFSALSRNLTRIYIIYGWQCVSFISHPTLLTLQLDKFTHTSPVTSFQYQTFSPHIILKTFCKTTAANKSPHTKRIQISKSWEYCSSGCFSSGIWKTGLWNPKCSQWNPEPTAWDGFRFPLLGNTKIFFFPVPKTLTFKMRPSAQPLISCENELYLHEIEKSFPYQRLST